MNWKFAILIIVYSLANKLYEYYNGYKYLKSIILSSASFALQIILSFLIFLSAVYSYLILFAFV